MGLELLILLPAAFLAGVLMFLAPCTLPIVPGYLAFIAGGEPAGSNDGSGRKKVMRNAFAFVIGFSTLFVLLGTSAGFLGGIVGPWQHVLSRVAGAIMILFGITMLGLFQIPFISSERHIRIPTFLTLGRPESSALIGALFAVGWSPCIGPLLGTILLLASTSATAFQGGLLLLAFSFGLAIPFLLSAFFIDKIGTLFIGWGNVTRILSIFGGVVLITLGLLMLFNMMGLLITYGYALFEFMEYDRLLQYL